MNLPHDFYNENRHVRTHQFPLVDHRAEPSR